MKIFVIASTAIARSTLLMVYITLTSCAVTQPRVGTKTPSAYDEMIRAANEATAPTEEELRLLKYGEVPKNHEKIFKKVVSEQLKDPDSSKFRKIKKPKKMWGKSLSLIHFWIICGEVNSKNSFGGYVGFEPYAVQVFADGTQDVLTLESGVTNFTFASARNPCGG